MTMTETETRTRIANTVQDAVIIPPAKEVSTRQRHPSFSPPSSATPVSASSPSSQASGSSSALSRPSAASPLSVRLTPSAVLSPTALNARSSGAREFSWSYTDEPHTTRRRQILEAHPEIRDLFGVEPLTFPIVVLILLSQLCMAYAVSGSSWLWIFVLAWAVGGTLNHSLQLAVHELSHNLCFASPVLNRSCAILANLATGFPSSVSFQKYHMDHHQWQGVDGVDTDIPTQAEVSLFVSSLLKLSWIVLQPVFYAVRPTMVRPKPYGRWELTNIGVQIVFNLCVAQCCGIKGLSYLILGTLLGLGLHPAAGHFIAEHYELVSGQETYSYYGFFNRINFNVGYHNEHHDFPRVPWSRLPAVTAIAPEFYLTLPHYTSYLLLFWLYITDPRLGPHARVKRAASESSRAQAAAHAAVKGRRWQGWSFVLIAIAWFTVSIGYVAYHVMKA